MEIGKGKYIKSVCVAKPLNKSYGWWRGAKLFLVGGNSNNGANSSLVYVNSNNAFSNSNTNRGARNDNKYHSKNW